MKTVEIAIKGTAPLLINRFKENDELPTTMRKGGKKDFGSPREQAESTAYRDEDTGALWVPTSWVKGAIQSIASDYKLPGTRKSVKSVAGGAIIPTTEKAYFSEGHKLEHIEIDSRPCVVQRARIMRHRARLETWSLKFSIEIDEEILELANVHQILSDAGRRAGLGDYRPQKGGPFGRFIVTEWNEC
jgi:hypothetical protein